MLQIKNSKFTIPNHEEDLEGLISGMLVCETMLLDNNKHVSFHYEEDEKDGITISLVKKRSLSVNYKTSGLEYFSVKLMTDESGTLTYTYFVVYSYRLKRDFPTISFDLPERFFSGILRPEDPNFTYPIVKFTECVHNIANGS